MWPSAVVARIRMYYPANIFKLTAETQKSSYCKPGPADNYIFHTVYYHNLIK